MRTVRGGETRIESITLLQRYQLVLRAMNQECRGRRSSDKIHGRCGAICIGRRARISREKLFQDFSAVDHSWICRMLVAEHLIRRRVKSDASANRWIM